MRDAYHEVVRILTAQDLALTNLEAALGREPLDREADVGRCSSLSRRLDAN
jgi:hypothetical protein